MLEKVIQLAKENDYDSAKLVGEWNGYNVYMPFVIGDEQLYLGIAEIILEKDGEIRFGTSDEDYAYFESKTPKLSKRLIAKCMKILNGTA